VTAMGAMTLDYGGYVFRHLPVGSLAFSLVVSAGDPSQDPAAIASYNDQVELILSRLSEQEQRVLQLRLLGNSTADVARQLGLNGDVLRVQLSRLRKRLRANGVMSDWV